MYDQLSPRVLPTFGAEPRLGTNPIAVAAPARNEPPFVFDAATCTVAGNKLHIARRLGTKLEPGWMADREGNPIMEEMDPPSGEAASDYTLLPWAAPGKWDLTRATDLGP